MSKEEKASERDGCVDRMSKSCSSRDLDEADWTRERPFDVITTLARQLESSMCKTQQNSPRTKYVCARVCELSSSFWWNPEPPPEEIQAPAARASAACNWVPRYRYLHDLHAISAESGTAVGSCVHGPSGARGASAQTASDEQSGFPDVLNFPFFNSQATRPSISTYEAGNTPDDGIDNDNDPIATHIRFQHTQRHTHTHTDVTYTRWPLLVLGGGTTGWNPQSQMSR